MPIDIVEGSERQPSDLGAVQIVGKQAEVAEEHIHALSVGHRRG